MTIKSGSQHSTLPTSAAFFQYLLSDRIKETVVLVSTGSILMLINILKVLLQHHQRQIAFSLNPLFFTSKVEYNFNKV